MLPQAGNLGSSREHRDPDGAQLMRAAAWAPDGSSEPLEAEGPHILAALAARDPAPHLYPKAPSYTESFR